MVPLSSENSSIILFGGLAGDDKNPVRFNDTWKL